MLSGISPFKHIKNDFHLDFYLKYYLKSNSYADIFNCIISVLLYDGCIKNAHRSRQ